MKIDKRKLEVVRLVDEEGINCNQLAKEYNNTYATIRSWYDDTRGLYYVMKKEKDNPDHIIHLDIEPRIYNILSRVKLYSIDEILNMIENDTINNIRGIGGNTLSDLIYAISSYKHKTSVEILYSTAYKNKRILKLYIKIISICTTGIFEYDINSKEKKLYLETKDNYNIPRIQDTILKEIDIIIDKDPSLGIILE